MSWWLDEIFWWLLLRVSFWGVNQGKEKLQDACQIWDWVCEWNPLHDRVHMCVRIACVCVFWSGLVHSKLPVRGWHHQPPSQPYIEDNWALLLGSCGVSFLSFFFSSHILPFFSSSSFCYVFSSCRPGISMLFSAWGQQSKDSVWHRS